MENFKVIIVEDVPLELKGTEGIFKNDIPEAEIIGTAESEIAYWKLIKQQLPDSIQYRAIQVAANTVAEAKVKADSIQGAIAGGADFEAVAKKYGLIWFCSTSDWAVPPR